MTMKIDGIEVPQIKGSELDALLPDGKNLCIYGNKGIGKSKRIIDYAKRVGKKLIIFSLATMIPEFIGGVPYAKVDSKAKTEYFTLLLNDMLQPIIESKGKGYILFFDEINQAPTEVMNCLYSICHIDPEQRSWCGHPIPYVQIVAAGNLNDGTDGTVYLNELPTPLHDRFFVVELIADATETMKYLKEKYKNLPLVTKYIECMQENKINPRNIEECLKILEFKQNPIYLRAKLGNSLTAQILDIQKSVAKLSPDVKLTRAKKCYQIFKEQGSVIWGIDTIATDEDLIDKFKTELGMSDEEITAVMKGDE